LFKLQDKFLEFVGILDTGFNLEAAVQVDACPAGMTEVSKLCQAVRAQSAT
jgi:hypothetical protein